MAVFLRGYGRREYRVGSCVPERGYYPVARYHFVETKDSQTFPLASTLIVFIILFVVVEFSGLFLEIGIKFQIQISLSITTRHIHNRLHRYQSTRFTVHQTTHRFTVNPVDARTAKLAHPTSHRSVTSDQSSHFIRT